MLNDKNEIKSGDKSTNIQGKDVTVNQNNGMSYSDVRQVAMDVFKSNFYDLGEGIDSLLYQRAEEIINKYLDKLLKDSPESLINTKDPDIRYSIYNVQKNHARLGNEDLADLMVDALVERTKLKEQDLLKLIMNESLEVMPKLTMKQIDTLTIIFILRYVNIKDVIPLNNLPDVLSLFSKDMPKDEWFYQHLQYASCISISIGSVDLEKVLNEKYQEQLPQGVDITSYFKNRDPKILNLLDVWKNSRLESSSLTSVGIAIALSNFRQKTNNDWNLNIWINE